MLVDSNGLTITGGPSVTTAGIDAGSKKITNVADGVIAVGSKDAVNGGQLYTASNDLTQSGLDFTDAEGNSVHRDLGDALTVIGSTTQKATGLDTTGNAADGTYSASNVQTYADAATGKMQVQFADAPVFGGDVTAQAFSVDGSAVSLSNTGLNNGGNKITNVADGQITSTSTDAVNGSQLFAVAATASTGWDMTTGKTAGTNGLATGTTLETIQPGEKVTYEAGNNMVVSQSGNTVSYGLNPDLTGITSITAGNTLVNTNGLTITGGPSVTTTGIDAGSKTITNVADGQITSTSTDAVNGSQLLTAVNDLTQSGLDFTDAGGNSVHRDLGDALTVIGSTTQKTTGLDTTGNAADGTYSASNVQTYADAATGKMQVQFADAPVFGGDVTAQAFDVDGSAVSLSNTGLNNGGNKITNVADGAIASGSKDAVNGGQLYTAINNSIGTVNLTFGANDADTVTRQNSETLLIKGDALTAGAYSGNNIKTDADPSTGTINIQMADSPKFGNVVVNDGGTGKITGVNAGIISSTSTDAVNGSQLYDTNQRIGGLDNRLDHVGAMSAALSGIQAGTFIESSPTQVGVGGGTYNGKVAIAAGVNHYTSKRVLFNAGAGLSGGEMMGRAGVTIALGTAPKKRPSTDSSINVDQLREIVRQQNSQILGLVGRINDLEAKMAQQH